MQNVTILIGAQWGDEGKGKWVDILAARADVVARFQGGNNAGHTLYIEGEKVVLHQIPSGVFHKKTCALAAGVVVNPSELLAEIDLVKKSVDISPDNLWLSSRAHVITPWHIEVDGQRERNRDQPIGTTKRGIGPTYAYKAARMGLRLASYADELKRRHWVEMMMRDPDFKAHFDANTDAWSEFHAAAEALAPFVCDAEARLRDRIRDPKQEILLEGAQGALLDIDHGTYPFVTSSSTAAGGACASLGFSPKSVKNIYGVAKAYATRVGAGPFPTELDDAVGETLAKRGHEFGATTGRPRRCGWLDGVALRYAYDVNGLDGVVLNKLDILTGLDEIKVAVAYEHPQIGRIDNFPCEAEVLDQCEPIYQSTPSWKTDLQGDWSSLPTEFHDFISLVEEVIRGPVSMIGTGVNRQDAIFRDK